RSRSGAPGPRSARAIASASGSAAAASRPRRASDRGESRARTAVRYRAIGSGPGGAGAGAGRVAPSRRPGTTVLLLLPVAHEVLVALLGQEPLAVQSEVLLERVAADDRVEGRRAFLGAEDAAEALRLLLPGAVAAAHLDRDARAREVDREV